ncbi:hypothetical protein M409DRAFT_18041 [Zasmidium cellare ATCC 36951]|uniref:Uncharacterized protein n=1 Tax=Zasmidium cellare ATCC 36951 TaxID=1080233 RepID=A0A6A6D071_ZASCE|nr:uncharacterized protein M409DRAFT_18041 [Zasmidium cellare ATCC 36951]KAF2171808.1 hypothetical protein M409DRAFT_18041 [Zasmidium cellare ATCC 36951]
MPQQQKAVFVREIKKPVELGARDVPTPKDGQVLVKVTATMLLPHDAYGRDMGLFMDDKLPYIPGANVAGIVEQVQGSSVFEKGNHVFGMSDFMAPLPDQQGLQEYAVLNVDDIARVPEGFSDDQAVSLPVNIITSFLALFDAKYGLGFPAPWDSVAGQSVKDQTLVIVGGGSSTGKLAIQLAKIAGFGKITTVAGSKNKDELEKMGATHVVDRHGTVEEVTSRVHAITGPDVTLILDTVNQSFELSTTLLSKDKESKLVTFLPNHQPEALAEQRPNCKSVFVEGGNENLAPHREAFWKHVPEWLKAGKILPTSYWTLEGLENVDKINAVLDGYMAGAGGAQLIVHP